MLRLSEASLAKALNDILRFEMVFTEGLKLSMELGSDELIEEFNKLKN